MPQAQALLEQVRGKRGPQGMDADLAVDPALGDDGLHRGLGAAAIHVGPGLADPRHRPGREREQPPRVTMPAPQRPQCLVGQIGQRHQPILVALAAMGMHLSIGAVDVAHLQRQGFPETQAHRVGDQQEYPIAQLTSGADQLFYLGASENIQEGLGSGCLDEIEPGPVAFEYMFSEALQAIAVDLHGAPGV